MGTRSGIGILNEDKTITAVYCHYDGYPSHVGVCLLKGFNSEEKTRELLTFGDISSLGSELGEKHDFDWKTWEFPEDDSRLNWATFYKRDRGEKNTDARQLSGVEEFEKKFAWSDYYYLFSDGHWTYRRAYADAQRKYKPLKDWERIEDELNEEES